MSFSIQNALVGAHRVSAQLYSGQDAHEGHPARSIAEENGMILIQEQEGKGWSGTEHMYRNAPSTLILGECFGTYRRDSPKIGGWGDFRILAEREYGDTGFCHRAAADSDHPLGDL